MTTHTILRLPQVIRQTGLSRSTIYLLMKTGRFPQSLRLGGRSMGFLEHEINAWIDSRVQARNAKGKCEDADAAGSQAA